MKKFLSLKNLKKKIDISFFYILGIFFLSFYAIKDKIFAKGLLVQGDWGIPPFASQISVGTFRSLFTWSNINLLGSEHMGPYLSAYFANSFLGLLHISGFILVKLILLFLFFISGISAYFLCLYLSKSKFAAFLSAMLYMFTPFVFNRLWFGHIYLIYAYAFIPLIFLFFLKGSRNKNYKYIIVAAIIAGFVAVQVQINVLLFFLLFSYGFFDICLANDNKVQKIWLYIKQLTLFSIIVLAMNLYWILPIVMTRYMEKIGSSGVLSDIWMNWLSIRGGLVESLRMIGFYDPQYESAIKPYGNIGIIATCIFPLLAFLSMIFTEKQNKDVKIYFLLIAFLFAGIALGPRAPLIGCYYEELYSKLFFIKAFRDITKYWLLLPLAYAVLSAYFFSNLFKNLDWIATGKLKPIKYIFLAAAAALALCYSFPFLKGDFIKRFNSIEYDNGYEFVNDWIEEQEGEFKALYLPSDFTMMQNGQVGLRDFMNNYSSHFGSIGATTGSTSDNDFEKFLSFAIYGNKDNFENILALSGVKYVIYQEDWEANHWEYFGKTYPVGKVLFTYLNQNEFLRPLFVKDKLHVYENLKFTRIASAVNQLNIIAGDKDYLLQDDFDPNEPIVFLRQMKSPQGLSNININKKISYSCNTKPEIELERESLYSAPLLKYAKGTFNSGEWTSLLDWYWFSNFAATTSIDRPIIAGAFGIKDGASFTFGYDNKEMGDYFMLIKVLADKNSDLEIENKGRILKQMHFEDNLGGFIWIPIKQYMDEGINEIKVTAIKGEIIISRIEISKNYIGGINNKFYETSIAINKNDVECGYGSHLDDNNGSDSHIKHYESNIKRISPTKYILDIKDSPGRVFVSLSEKFNPLWKIYLSDNNKKQHFFSNYFNSPMADENNHYIANGYANGWVINKMGDFRIVIEFWPQRFFEIGLTIGIAIIFVSLVFLIVPSKIKITKNLINYTKKYDYK